MRNLISLAALVACISFHSQAATERRVILNFAANPTVLSSSGSSSLPDTPLSSGHAWVIRTVIENDGRRTSTSSGWYPGQPDSDTSIPLPIYDKIFVMRAEFGAEGGRVEPYDPQDIDRVYFSVELTPEQDAKVLKIIENYTGDNHASYNFIRNCVEFDHEIAAAAGLNTPLRGSFLTTPVSYMEKLAELNPDRLKVPVTSTSQPVEAVTRYWQDFIQKATDLSHVKQDLRWRAYQPAHNKDLADRARTIETNRTSLQVAENKNDRALSSKAGNDAAYYNDAIRRSIDNSRGYGGGQGPILFGGSTGTNQGTGGGSIKPPECGSPVCLFYDTAGFVRSSAAQARGRFPGSSRALLLQAPKMSSGARADAVSTTSSVPEASAAGYIAASLTKGAGSPSASPGFNYLLSVGPVVIGAQVSTVVYLTNLTDQQLKLHVTASGSYTTLQIGTGVAANALAPFDIAPNAEVAVAVLFQPSDITKQDLQRLVVQANDERPLEILLDYFLLSTPTLTLTNTVGPFVSGLGGAWNKTPYTVSLGPAPLFYTLSGQPLMTALGQRDRMCRNTEIHRWLDCKPVRNDDTDVAWTFSIQGLEDTVSKPADTVTATATLSATYKVIQSSPSLIGITPDSVGIIDIRNTPLFDPTPRSLQRFTR